MTGQQSTRAGRRKHGWLGYPEVRQSRVTDKSGGMYLEVFVDLAGTSDQLCVLGMSCDHPHLWT